MCRLCSCCAESTNTSLQHDELWYGLHPVFSLICCTAGKVQHRENKLKWTLAHQLTALSALCCNPGGGRCSLQLVITILHTLSLILAGFVDLWRGRFLSNPQCMWVIFQPLPSSSDKLLLFPELAAPPPLNSNPVWRLHVVFEIVFSVSCSLSAQSELWLGSNIPVRSRWDQTRS